MEVDLKITFGRKELEAMCLKRCEAIETVVPGHFEARSQYGEVECTFVPDVEAAPVPILPPTLQMSISVNKVAPPPVDDPF